MTKELQIIDESAISIEVKEEINEDIDRIIEQHKNNRQAINKLVFESVAAMTEADNAQAELSNKGWFKRRWGSITGSNSRLQDRINSNRANAMYASQRTLQKLAEQNVMTFDLIAAVNNKLNASLIKVDAEFENIYKGLAKFFKTNRSELARFEARLEKVERNVGLLNWQTAIEYQEFEGVEYADLDDVTKIVCLVRDFYDITKGEWSNSDLLILKSAMRDIDISPKDTVNYFGVMKCISYNEKLKEYMLNGNAIMQIEDPSYLLSLGCIKKFETLNNEENYLVDTIADYMNTNGIIKEREVICSDLTTKYLANKAYVNVDIEVDCYDLILDLLYNIKQAKDEYLLLAEQEETLVCVVEENTSEANEPEDVANNIEVIAEEIEKPRYGLIAAIESMIMFDDSNRHIAAGMERFYENIKAVISKPLRVKGKVIFKNCEIIFSYDGNIGFYLDEYESEVIFQNCEFKIEKVTEEYIFSSNGLLTFKDCLFDNVEYGGPWCFINVSMEFSKQPAYLVVDHCHIKDCYGTFIRADGKRSGENFNVIIRDCLVENHTGNFLLAQDANSSKDTGVKIIYTNFEKGNSGETLFYKPSLIEICGSRFDISGTTFTDIEQNIFGCKGTYASDVNVTECSFVNCQQRERVAGTVSRCELNGAKWYGDAVV